MANSNEKLIERLEKMKQVLKPKNLRNIAGEMLVENIREQAGMKFKKGNSEWEYEFHDSFSRDDVVFYDESKKQVKVNHPAAKTLEYGLRNDLTIRPKNAKSLSFIGRDGERIYTKEVKIPKESRPPIGYAYSAMKKTKQEFKTRIKEELE